MLTLHYGSDSYRLREATCALAPHAVIDGTDEDAAEQIERELKYPSFFQERRVVIVRNAASAAFSGLLKQFDVSAMTDVDLVAVQDTNRSYDKKTLALLAKSADIKQEWASLAGTQLAAWARNFCKERGATIEPAALTLLVHRVGTDTSILCQELEKLCAYASGTAINIGVVQVLTPVRSERDEWELSNALASCDKRAAITALWRRLQEGTADQLLLGTMAAGIRNLLSVNDLVARRQPAGVIAKTTGLHPFVVSKTLRSAATADRTRLRRAHLALAALDRNSKDGHADMVDGLFSILLSL